MIKLATRCDGCGTLFGVVRDQLWVSSGWVRCGGCGRSFNAFDQLYDLTKGKPPAWHGAGEVAPEGMSPDPALAEPVGVAEVAAQAMHEEPTRAPLLDAGPATADNNQAGTLLEAPLQEPAAGAVCAASDKDGIEAVPAVEIEPSGPLTSRPVPAEASPLLDPALEAIRGDDNVSPSGQETPPPAVIEEPAEAFREGTAEPTPAVADAPAIPTWAPIPATVPTPEFLRRADKQARWTRPSVRLALGGVGLGALLVLTLQAALHFRHGLAAESPRARQTLSWLCTKLGCTIEAPRRIADLTVESSALTRVAGNDQLIRLSLTLRNRGRVALAMPALDLTLKNGAGQVLVRRAIQADEVPAAPATLPAGIDVPLQLLVATDGRRIAAYTVEIFYP